MVKIRWAVRTYGDECQRRGSLQCAKGDGVDGRSFRFIGFTYHFEEKTLRDVHVRRQRSLHNRDVGRDDTADHPSSAHGSKDLSREQDEASEGWERSGDHHAECDGGVEQTSTDAIEYPCCD